MGSTNEIDYGGLTLVVKDVKINASTPGAAGSLLSTTELGLIDGVTAGTITASKAVTANSSGTVPHIPVIVKHTTGSTLALTALQSGGKIYLAKADGVTITLPASSVGLSYDFIVYTSVTSNAYKISTATQGTEFFDGTINSSGDAAAASVVFTGNGTTEDNLSMNGTTTGGLVGTMLNITCTAANKWTVSGWLVASGSEATPFATS